MTFIDPLYGQEERKPLLCSLQKAFPYNHPTFFVRRNLYEQFGLFNMNYKYAMDFEWVCRLYADPLTTKVKFQYLSCPLTVMYAGGASSKMELRSIDELEKALRAYGFWSFKAYYFQTMRRLRIHLKKNFEKLSLNFIVKIWRKIKWCE